MVLPRLSSSRAACWPLGRHRDLGRLIGGPGFNRALRRWLALCFVNGPRRALEACDVHHVAGRDALFGGGSAIGRKLRLGSIVGRRGEDHRRFQVDLVARRDHLGEREAAVEELVGRRRRQRQHLDVPALKLRQPAARTDFGLQQPDVALGEHDPGLDAPSAARSEARAARPITSERGAAQLRP